MPGISCFIFPVGTEPIVIQVIPIDDMLNNGIALKDLGQYLQTDTGLNSIGQSDVISLTPGMILYVPNGLLAVPVCTPPEATKQEVPKKDARMQVGFVGHVPVLSSTLLKAMPENVFQAVAQYNSEHLAKQKQQRIWTARHDLFEKVVVSVKST